MKKFMDEWNKGYEKGYDDAMKAMKAEIEALKQNKFKTNNKVNNEHSN
jgi:hypothetical protein